MINLDSGSARNYLIPDNSNKANVLTYFLGKCIEAFDFTIYGLLVSRIANLFFPPDTSSAQTFGWLFFAVSYFARPFGGLLFGYLGTFVSKNTAVTAGLYSMAISSLIIGVLPSYVKIGFLAPLALLLCRIIQGLAMAAEFPGSTALMMENYKKNVGLVASLISAAGTLGILLGSFSILISDKLVPLSISWRIPFMIGGTLSILAGIYVQKSFYQASPIPSAQSLSFLSALNNLYKLYRIQMLQTIFLSALIGVNFNVGCLWWSAYVTSINLLHPTAVSFLLNLGLVMIVLLSPLIGILADRYGFRNTILIGIVVNGLFLPLSLYLTGKGQLTLAQLFFALSGIGFSPIALVYVLKIFPSHIRYTGVSLAWNIGAALIGSTSPIISQALLHLSQQLGVLPVCLYVMVLSFITIFMIVKSPYYNYE